MYRHRGSSGFEAGFRQPQFSEGVRLLNSVDGPIVRLADDPSDLVNIAESLTSNSGAETAPTPPDFSARTVAFGEIVSRLAELQTDPSLEDEAGKLLDVLLDIEPRVCDLIVKHRAQKFEHLKERHETARAAARAAKDARDAIQLEVGPAKGLLRRAQENTSKCRIEVSAWEDSKPKPESFPTKSETREWERGIEAAKKELASAAENERDVLDQLQEIEGHLQAKQAELKKLAEVEFDLRTAMSGKAVFDRETGLAIPAGKF